MRGIQKSCNIAGSRGQAAGRRHFRKSSIKNCGIEFTTKNLDLVHLILLTSTLNANRLASLFVFGLWVAKNVPLMPLSATNATITAGMIVRIANTPRIIFSQDCNLCQPRCFSSAGLAFAIAVLHCSLSLSNAILYSVSVRDLL